MPPPNDFQMSLTPSTPPHRDSDVNPNAAPIELKQELLRVGPHCLSEDETTILFCSPNASRTQRAGIYELLFLARDDRRYCENEFFRRRMTRDANTSEDCRAELYERNASCHLECAKSQILNHLAHTPSHTADSTINSIRWNRNA